MKRALYSIYVQHTDRIRVTTLPAKTKGSGYKYDEVESTLEMSNVSISDKGTYGCSVTSPGSNAKFTETTIHIFGLCIHLFCIFIFIVLRGRTFIVSIFVI